MSFAMTTDQIRARSKTVTRRFGWWFLQPGDRIQAVEKSMGLKKGQHVKLLAMLRVVSMRTVRLCDICQEDCVKEGFPDVLPRDFAAMLIAHYRCDRLAPVNRIEFEYI
jgi:hypothetical protein